MAKQNPAVKTWKKLLEPHMARFNQMISIPNKIKIGAWDTRNKNKFPTLFDKAEFIRKDLKKLQKTHKINEIFIEQPFAFFKSGGSTAKTMATLQKYNGVISWLCYDVFGIILDNGWIFVG